MASRAPSGALSLRGGGWAWKAGNPDHGPCAASPIPPASLVPSLLVAEATPAHGGVGATRAPGESSPSRDLVLLAQPRRLATPGPAREEQQAIPSSCLIKTRSDVPVPPPQAGHRRSPGRSLYGEA